jgi:protein-S-isoprenylcysteine O-methyltransferase Ste14
MSAEFQARPRDPDLTASVGGWLFRQRSWLPLPLIFALLLIPADPAAPPALRWAGVGMTLAGELLRLWGVRHIGAVSRTRSERLGPLVDTGPFGFVRNPLYIGNVMLWLGFALTAGLAWLAPFIALLLGLEYHAIVRWEERLLHARLGERYRAYAAQVPRWIPRWPGTGPTQAPSSLGVTWADTLFTERGTLLAIATGYVLLFLKERT